MTADLLRSSNTPTSVVAGVDHQCADRAEDSTATSSNGSSSSLSSIAGAHERPCPPPMVSSTSPLSSLSPQEEPDSSFSILAQEVSAPMSSFLQHLLKSKCATSINIVSDSCGSNIAQRFNGSSAAATPDMKQLRKRQQGQLALPAMPIRTESPSHDKLDETLLDAQQQQQSTSMIPCRGHDCYGSENDDDDDRSTIPTTMTPNLASKQKQRHGLLHSATAVKQKDVPLLARRRISDPTDLLRQTTRSDLMTVTLEDDRRRFSLPPTRATKQSPASSSSSSPGAHAGRIQMYRATVSVQHPCDRRRSRWT
eukprot:CAMPEP_0119554816 /NCGR_PEP_ID=MMETSP1352-20130426/7190_1 /TAXON_ID=265584 /ORGANISM="Stauroneis constricta, Strain CCMP1120" /LENGTH=309 /DNA_ID=CAMNT_0007601463 /DNA_START=364 /DNA_END=1293 /DNA_ORIENTATION=+